jgi:exopolysaccharide biosynthesis polyprenyl glycosylphosphotransferase
MAPSSSTRRRFVVSALKVVDLAVVAVSLLFTLVLMSSETSILGTVSFFEMRLKLGNVLFGVSYVLAWNLILRLVGLYESQRLATTKREIQAIAAAVAIAVVPLIPLRVLFDLDALRHGATEAFALAVFVALVAERVLLRVVVFQLRLRGRNLRFVLFVGDAREAAYMADTFARRETLGYRILSTVEVSGLNGGDEEAKQSALLARVEAELKRHAVDEVFVSLPLVQSTALVERLVSLCDEEGVVVRILSRLSGMRWAWASIDSLLGQPVITVSSLHAQLDFGGMLTKRVLDVVVSGATLILLAPVLALVMIAIKLDSRGPILFSQKRVGFNRRHFRVYKFRTMVEDAEERQSEIEHLNEAEGAVFKIEKDPRLTRIGGFLRRTSLDEFPQLFNVIRGDMSLVGPRPLPVRDFERIETRWHRRRFSVKPGVTCLWQVARREPKFNEWVKMDMEYIDNWSLALDLKILAKTISAVLSGHGAH